MTMYVIELWTNEQITLGTGISVFSAMNFMVLASDRGVNEENLTHVLLVRKRTLPLCFRKGRRSLMAARVQKRFKRLSLMGLQSL